MMGSIPATHRHPKGFFHIAALMACEFFSYYGMRYLLVLFFTQTLLFTDAHAYSLYGSYTALVWVTPMLGGYLADRFLGYANCVIAGSVMIFAGNVLLALSGTNLHIIYFAMGIIICGYGFFKGNISCLAGSLYNENSMLRHTGFSWLYVCGNIGGLLAAIICGWATYKFHDLHIAFLVASSALLFGNIFFIFGFKHFPSLEQEKKALLNASFQLTIKNWLVFRIQNKYWFIIGTTLAIFIFKSLLYWEGVGYLILVTAIIAFVYIGKVFLDCSATERKSLLFILLFMTFSVIFWIMDQQTGSSVTLFINRNIEKHLFGIPIPTVSFQVANGLGVIIGGFLVSWLWSRLKKANIQWTTLIKLAIGCLLFSIGFSLIALASSQASHSLMGKAPMMLVVLGILIAGIAELFVDPVIIADITRLNPGKCAGILVGIYLLMTGSLANFLSGHLAQLTDVSWFHEGMTGLALADVARVYMSFFNNITLSGIGLTALLIITGFIIHRLLGIKEGV